MKTVVTGASSFRGINLVRALLKQVRNEREIDSLSIGLKKNIKAKDGSKAC